jgi:hypothetical protein
MFPPSELLGITTWLTWAIRDEISPAGQSAFSPIATVSHQRLTELGPVSLQAAAAPGVGFELHQLLRFNLLNLGDDPATVCAVALRTTSGAMLPCELAVPVVIRAGARYPFMLEVRSEVVSEAVDVQVERVPGDRVWISASCLPNL